MNVTGQSTNTSTPQPTANTQDPTFNFASSGQDFQKAQTDQKAFEEEKSGRNNATVKTGEGIAQAGLGLMSTNWIAGVIVSAIGMITKGVGYMQEGKTGKGLATMFGGHVGEWIAEGSEGDFSWERAAPTLTMGISSAVGGASKSGQQTLDANATTPQQPTTSPATGAGFSSIPS